MKKIILLAATICLCMNVFAQKNVQSIKYEGALAQAITQERYNRLMNESPSKLLDTYFDANHYCYISNQLPENARMMGDVCNYVSPDQVCDDASTVVSTKLINHHKYAMIRDEAVYNAYAIGNTGYYVIVNPVDVYQRNYRAFMKEYGF